MTETTLSSREFNQDTGGARRSASAAPVLITDRGKPSHVLMSYEHYRSLVKPRGSIVEQLAMPDATAVRFSPRKLRRLTRPADLA